MLNESWPFRFPLYGEVMIVSAPLESERYRFASQILPGWLRFGTVQIDDGSTNVGASEDQL